MTDDVTALREQLERLATENASLRAQMQRMASEATQLAPHATPGVSVVSRRRRWGGRALAVTFAILTFLMGVMYAREVGTDMADGYRDGRNEARARRAGAVPPPAGTP